jgi:hypothetical protein
MTDCLPPKERKCHHTGFSKSCRQLVADGACGKWDFIQGANPQDGAPMMKWDCSENFTHFLLIEIAKASHEGTKATLDFRNAALDPEVRARQIEDLKKTKAIEAH